MLPASQETAVGYCNNVRCLIRKETDTYDNNPHISEHFDCATKSLETNPSR